MIFVKLAEEKLNAPTRRELQEFERNRNPDRDALVGALAGGVRIGVPAGLLAAGVYKGIKGDKATFAKGLKRALPVTVAGGALMGLSSGAAGNPRYAHPVDYISDRDYRRKSRNVYETVRTNRIVKRLRDYDDFYRNTY